jgi:predicted aspartyl protease
LSRHRPFPAVVVALGLALTTAVCAPTLACTVERIDEWQVRSVNNHLIVDGTLNGRPIGVMLDTGAMRTAVLQSAARRLDLPTRRAVGYRMFGVGGEAQVELTQVESFGIGPNQRRHWPMIVVGAPDFAPGFDVILGDDFFHRVDVEFDLARGVVRLFQTKDCDAVALASWTRENAGEVDIERVHEASPQIVFPVKVNGTPVLALLDSGSPFSVLTKQDAALAGLTPKSPHVSLFGHSRGIGPKLVEVWIGPIDVFTIGDIHIRDTAILFADLFGGAQYKETGSLLPRRADLDQKMLLGMDFLRAHRVFVAHSQRKLYFSYVGGPVFQTRRARSPDGPRPPATPERSP